MFSEQELNKSYVAKECYIKGYKESYIQDMVPALRMDMVPPSRMVKWKWRYGLSPLSSFEDGWNIFIKLL